MDDKTQTILQHCVNADLLKIRELFQAKGFDIRIVGGAVRDILCGHAPKDIDLATDAFPDEAITIYEANGIRFEPTGIDHGTISVIMNGETYEITSLRYDTETDGRHAKVTFTRLWYEDLARRDLTINAMSMTFDGVLDDPYDGQTDLAAGVVQFVGDPELRIQEDYLRILRYFRFSGRFSGTFDPKQLAAIKKHAAGLKQVSRERVWQEVSKIMTHSSAPHVYAAMAECDVLQNADLPTMSDTAMFNMATAVSHTNDPAVVFSTLFETKDQVVDYCKRLKMSTRDIRLMQYVLQLTPSLDDITLFESLKARIVFQDATKDDSIQAALRLGRKMVAEQIRDWVVPVFPVTGEDLIALGMKPSKELGSALMHSKYAWFSDGQATGKYADKETVLSIIKAVRGI